MEGDPLYTVVNRETQIDSGLLFSLAPAPQRWPRLMIIGGSPGTLMGLNWLLGVLADLGLKYDLFAPEATQKAVPWLDAQPLPEAGKLYAGKLQQSLTECQAIIAGLGLIVSSGTQIELEKILLNVDQPTLMMDELMPIYKTSPQLLQLSHLMPFLSLNQLIKLLGISRVAVKLAPGRGIYNVGALLAALPTVAPLVITYDSERLYTYVSGSRQIIHTAIPDGMSVDQLRATVVAAHALTVWTDRGAHTATEVVELIHYLLAHVESGNQPAAVGRQLRTLLEP